MQNQSQIIYNCPKFWSINCSKIIHNKVISILKLKGECSVMLTGGRSAKKIYCAWSELPEFQQLRNVCFFFSDERCVAPDSPDSNYGMVMSTLFKNNIPKGCFVFQIAANNYNTDFNLKLYSKNLPSNIDVMLLSLGDDGHVASIFPKSEILKEVEYGFAPVTSPVAPHSRISITPAVIQRAVCIYLFATGSAKSKVLLQVFSDFSDFYSLPARLVSNGIWFTDQRVINSKF
jgi:6-phosphogluconolactonase